MSFRACFDSLIGPLPDHIDEESYNKQQYTVYNGKGEKAISAPVVPPERISENIGDVPKTVIEYIDSNC